jgi:tetratricopeptide (TPR) repeat protein
MKTLLAWIIPLVLCAACAAPQDHSISIPSPSILIADVAARALDVPPIALYKRAVSGASPEAQRWFNQGLRYLYGFNHDAAAACFAQAAQASPECAMAWWGIAHAYSIDVNDAVVPQEQAIAAQVAIHEATRLAGLHKLSSAEAGLIAAEALRCVYPLPEDRSAIDQQYRESLAVTWASHQDDADVGVLYAESLMLLQPWNYWTFDGEPVQDAEKLVATLEQIFLVNDQHPAVNHFYIHAVEASRKPGRAEAAADRLAAVAPRTGHLVHMASHIYVLVGRYEEAVLANIEGARLDEEYLAAYPGDTSYIFYYMHNLHFAAYAAMMEGQRDFALQYMQRMEDTVPEEMVKTLIAFADGLLSNRMDVMIRFGMWKEILALPEYPEYRKVGRAVRRYARTVALANLGQRESARAELAHFDAAAAEAPEDWIMGFNSAPVVLALARLVAEAEILWREGNPEAAIPLLIEACEAERVLIYTEPPAWLIPVRHTLGAIQLASGDAAAAEATYREDLAKHVENGWSLLGLQQALMAQGKTTESAALQARVDAAWARAEVKPEASCYCALPIASLEKK